MATGAYPWGQGDFARSLDAWLSDRTSFYDRSMIDLMTQPARRKTTVYDFVLGRAVEEVWEDW